MQVVNPVEAGVIYSAAKGRDIIRTASIAKPAINLTEYETLLPYRILRIETTARSPFTEKPKMNYGC